MYNPTIGRFDRVDPIADEQENYSPYQYGWNNPIVNSDPNGLCPSCPQGEEAAKLYGVGAIVTNKEGSWQWTGSRWNDFTPNSSNRGEDPSGALVMEPISGFLGWAGQILNGNRRYNDGREVDSRGFLTNVMKPLQGDPPDLSSKGSIKTGLNLAKKLSNASLKMTLPSWKKIKVDIAHVLDGHMAGGKRLSQSQLAGGQKDVFPPHMSAEQIEKTVRSAYKNAVNKLQTQGDRILLQGTSDSGMQVEMWLNKATKTIETAYPKLF